MAEPTETPAATLRRAAALMRERAEAATPGPWAATGDRDSFVEQAAGVMPDGDAHIVAEMNLCADHPDWRRADAEYVASWHPPVALEVAALLLTVAGHADSGCCCGIASGAVDLARAYLGEQDGDR